MRTYAQAPAMGAYLSSPVTGKELYEGEKEGYLEYGGASMQARRLGSGRQTTQALQPLRCLPDIIVHAATQCLQCCLPPAPVLSRQLARRCAERGAGAAQGWRRTMEDAHIAAVDLGNSPDAAMFGVFDGHGGRCVRSDPLTTCLRGEHTCWLPAHPPSERARARRQAARSCTAACRAERGQRQPARAATGARPDACAPRVHAARWQSSAKSTWRRR